VTDQPRGVLVLAGGRGERFWPWSRPDRPKQLLPLASRGRTLLAATLDRALRITKPERVLVLTARDLVTTIERDCAGMGVTVMGEPVGRNTAAAIGVGARWFSRHGSDPAFIVMPSDHAIEDETWFTADVTQAFERAEREPVMVTFGIKPTAPETVFGYIRRGAPLASRVFRVAQFAEKPDRARAQAWVASGEYMWNAGIFVWRCSTFMNGLAAGRPALAAPLAAMNVGNDRATFERELDRVFPALESISVDFAVLEPAPNVIMIEASFDWDDLGSWTAWARRQPHDTRGNVLFGDAIAVDCDHCIVVGDGGTAAALKLRDMIVVNAGGGTLACRIEDSGDVRKIAEAAREKIRA